MQYEDKNIMKGFLKELYNVWCDVFQRFTNIEKLEYNQRYFYKYLYAFSFKLDAFLWFLKNFS